MINAKSPVIGTGVRAATPLAIVVSIYLLLAGHNAPGGGFAAGLVLGSVVALRTVVGLQRPTHGVGLNAAGLVIVVLTALAPVLFGGVLLDQAVWSFEVPVIGKVKTGSALPFDIGVMLIVVGLVVAVLDGLGATELAETPGVKPRPSTEGQS